MTHSTACCIQVMSEKALCHKQLPFLRARNEKHHVHSPGIEGGSSIKCGFWRCSERNPCDSACFQKLLSWSIQETSVFTHASRNSYFRYSGSRHGVTTEPESGKGWEFEITEYEIVNLNDFTIIKKKTLKTRRTFREICQLECRMCDGRVYIPRDHMAVLQGT